MNLDSLRADDRELLDLARESPSTDAAWIDRLESRLSVYAALERLYWFYRMVETGGPDGSELDEAVVEDARAAADHLDLGDPPPPVPSPS